MAKKYIRFVLVLFCVNFFVSCCKHNVVKDKRTVSHQKTTVVKTPKTTPVNCPEDANVAKCRKLVNHLENTGFLKGEPNLTKAEWIELCVKEPPTDKAYKCAMKAKTIQEQLYCWY